MFVNCKPPHDFCRRAYSLTESQAIRDAIRPRLSPISDVTAMINKEAMYSMRSAIRSQIFPRFLLALLACLFFVLPAGAADEATTVSENPAFQHGLAGWQVAGAVRLQGSASPSGTRAVILGPGPGSISQRVPASAKDHMMISATLHALASARAIITVRCLDKSGRELMSLESPGDIKPGKEPGAFDDYFRPHPLTASVEVVVSNGNAPGTVSIAKLALQIFNDDDPALKATQSTTDLMTPFWQGNHVSAEAVLLTSTGNEPATGTLMFRPAQILSVTSYDGSARYHEGADYRVEGRTLIASPNSSIARVTDSDLLHADLAWNVIGGKQVLVTYEHSDRWTGPVQAYVGRALPNTLRKLATRQPLRIVAYGDSITFGVGSSHMQKIPPYQSPWIDLFASKLRSLWQNPAIALFNSSQSGADSNWARAMAGRMVASLQPDLVIIAFGQNDFWNNSADTFAANITAIMRTVRAANPHAEFLLVSTTRFDPAYSSNPAHWHLVTQYDARLRAMTGPGVQLVDMTAISGAVFAAKQPRDCLNDPLHPNDYLSRWYAQSMIAALSPQQDPHVTASRKKGVGDDDSDAPQAIDATDSDWYYNWTPYPSKGDIHAEFVPMVWGPQNVDADLLAAVRSGAKNLLAFNEPDSQSEGNVTVDQAITLWPKLAATGLRLGSPATTTSSPWLDQFMTKAKETHLRVDFLCLHWYGDITAPDAVASLRTYLQSYWDRYHLPIWLTEFSGADFSFHRRKTTVEDNAKFASEAAAMMQQLPFVERYAWFGTAWTPDSKDYPTSGLYNNAAHALTPIGLAWREAGRNANLRKPMNR